jgi:glycosyltransferase involved in cell wall biosynthesis
LQRPVVLCFASYYLPGFKSGGPVRSLTNLCEWASDRFDVRVLTRNRDLGEAAHYPDCEPGTWHLRAAAGVTYLDESWRTPLQIRRAVLAAAPRLLYFQSFLDPLTTILPLIMRRFGLVPGTIPVAVAPRGELSPGALGLKARKKALYLTMARWLGLYRGISWHATSEAEVAHIRDWAGADARVFLASNLPRRVVACDRPARRPKRAGELQLVFISRVSRMKNLDGALAMLASAGVPATLDVYGMLEDPAYWSACQAQILALPPTIHVRYCGVVEPAEVPAVMDRYHALLLPTLGENFGHVILEALVAGCPVVISDRTPWRGLEVAHAGFDLDLDRPADFVAALRRLAAMDAAEYSEWSEGARRVGVEYSTRADVATPTLAMLDALTAR